MFFLAFSGEGDIIFTYKIKFYIVLNMGELKWKNQLDYLEYFFELGVLGSILGTIVGFFETPGDLISYKQVIEKSPGMKNLVIVVLVFIIVAQLYF